MERAKIERIGDIGIFCVDTQSFKSTILPYDRRMANQLIWPDWQATDVELNPCEDEAEEEKDKSD